MVRARIVGVAGGTKGFSVLVLGFRDKLQTTNRFRDAQKESRRTGGSLCCDSMICIKEGFKRGHGFGFWDSGLQNSTQRIQLLTG